MMARRNSFRNSETKGVVREGFLVEEALQFSHKLWGGASDGCPHPEGFIPFLNVEGFVKGGLAKTE